MIPRVTRSGKLLDAVIAVLRKLIRTIMLVKRIVRLWREKR